MPKALHDCVSSMMAKWRKDPSSAPTPKKGEKLEDVAYAMCTKSLQGSGKMESGMPALSLEEIAFSDPVMTGWGFTNKPHVQYLDEMSFVGEDGEPWSGEGKKYLKVPLLVMGRWQHPRGVLNFTPEVIARIEDNFKAHKAGHDVSADLRHNPQSGAMAWATGRFAMEKNRAGFTQWSIIAEPTPEGARLVEDKVYRYASIEVHPDFKDRMLSASLSADEITGPFVLDAIPVREDTMPKEVAVTLEDMQSRLLAMEQALAERDEELASMRRSAAASFVARIVAEAKNYRDSEGRAHNTVFLEWLEDVLLCRSIGEEDAPIVLEVEEANSPGAVHAYYRRSIDWLMRNMPGQVPMEPVGTERSKKRPVALGADDEWVPTEDDLQIIKDAWALTA